ncbi:MAG: hypothetical protein ACRD3O_10050 [Terriglobia bacterium]
MFPSQLKAGEFNDYPPQARREATKHLGLFQQLPLAFAPLLLQQIQEYDWKFPAERREIDGQLSYLGSLPENNRQKVLDGFARLKLSTELERCNWVDSPGRFSEELSAELWATHQIGAFKHAATSYMEKFSASLPPQKLPTPRLAIAVIGKGVEHNTYPLFRRLRPHGTYFTNVNPANGLRVLVEEAAARAAAHPVPYGAWYVDGGTAEAAPGSSLISMSYAALEPVRRALLRKIHKAIEGGIGGPEALMTMLHNMQPEDIGLSGTPADEVLSHFETSVFTGGQGTQIFSTTFVQWTARELWRRAQPLTILARFAPRQLQRPMNELLSPNDQSRELDVAGSLIDADMGAFYIWVEQQRLSGAEEASLLVWFENHSEALVISPFLARGTESSSAVDMKWLLRQMGLKTAGRRKPPQSHSAPAAALRPAKNNYVLDGTNNNEDMLDFLNWANYKSSA